MINGDHRAAGLLAICGLVSVLAALSVDGATSSPASAGQPGAGRIRQQLPPPLAPDGRVDLDRWMGAARVRANQMRQLMRTDPEAFVRASLPEEEYSGLPAEVAQFAERRIRGRGFFGAYCAVPKPDSAETLEASGRPGVEYEVRLGGRRYRAYPFGAWRDQGTVQEAEIEGVALEDGIVLGDSPTPEAQADAGGVVFADAPNLGGVNRVLYMIARFSDESAEPIAEDAALAQMGVVSAFWRNNSSGTVSLQGLVRPDLVMDVVHVVLPQPMSYGGTYNGDFSGLLTDARAAALAAGFVHTDYSLDVLVTSDQSFSYAGRAYIGGQGAHLVKPYTSLRTAGHELGHNLGLYHANYWRTDSTHPYGSDRVPGGYVADTANAEWVEYGHYFSVMSAQSGGEMDDPTKPHYAVAEKAKLGWLSGSEVAHASASGSYRLFRQDHPGTTGTPRALRIETPATVVGKITRYYWLSHRQAAWSSAQNWCRQGLQIDVCQSYYGNDGAVMLDMTPYSKDAATPFFDPNSKPGGWWTIDNEDKKDGVLVVGRTLSDAKAGIHVTPVAVGNNGTNEEYIDVVVNLGQFPGNQAPVIQALDATQLQAALNETVDFAATAIDPDGDTLAYAWDFDQVQVWTASGVNQPQATKSWSAAGQYRVRLTVSDLKGGTASDSVVVTVGAPANTRQIWGRVTWGGEPVEGARVWAQNGSTVYPAWSDADGTYVLKDLASATSYPLNCAAAGLTFTFQLANPVSVSAGDVFGADFHANEPRSPGDGAKVATISGTVTDGGQGVGAVEVFGGSRMTVTDGSGRYSLTNLTAGNYSVIARKAGWAFSPASQLVALNGTDVSGTDFARSAPYSLSGRVTGIPVGSQDPAPTVYLSRGRSVRATRQGSGASRYWGYTLPGVPAGDWSVTAELAGYLFMPATFTNPLAVASTLSGLNLSGSTGVVAGAVSGRVTEMGLPVAGVTVTFRQGGATVATGLTDSDGSFRSPSLPAGGCDVVPAKPGYAFAPGLAQVGAVPSAGVDFVAAGSSAPPVIVSLTASPARLTGPTETTTLAVVANGSGVLSYRWDLIQGLLPVVFSTNDGTGAASTLAQFQAAGEHVLRVQVADARGFTAVSNVTVRVEDGPGCLVVSPYEVVVAAGQSVAFTASAWDSLGQPLEVAPVWSVDGGGVIDATGQFTAGGAGGTFEVTAQAGGLAASARVSVTGGSLPVVGIQATDGVAGEWGADPGWVQLTRGSTGTVLTVTLDLGGTAAVGADYTLTGVDGRQGNRATVTFGAAESRRDIGLTALQDGLVEGVQDARVSVAAGAGYATSASREAVVRIEDAPFDAWRQARFDAAQLGDPAQIGEAADPDGDGLCNLLEYAFGLDPRTRETVGGPRGAVESRHLVFTYRESKMALDVQMIPEVRNDLDVDPWNTSALQEIGRTDQGSYWEVRVRDNVIIPYEVSRFMRLRVTRR